MLKKSFITTTLICACSGLFAQTITEKDLQEIQASFKKDAGTKAIQNILTTDKNIKDNALNRELQGKIDHYFKYRVNVKGITNQESFRTLLDVYFHECSPSHRDGEI